MKFENYFKLYKDWFWKWDDTGDYLSLSSGTTIVHRELLLQILKKMSPQGLPPLSPLLLTIVATNPQAEDSLDEAERLVIDSRAINSKQRIQVFRFLEVLSGMKEFYKDRDARIRLLCAIFEHCHNRVNSKYSLEFTLRFSDEMQGKPYFAVAHEANQQVFAREFNVLDLISRKLDSREAIEKKIMGLPEIPADLVLPDETPAATKGDILDRLLENPHTFYMAALVKRLWSGFHIPAHQAVPSDQPLGGVADLTNKGQLDKLLLSEFAHDDDVLLSRLANSEALYYQREQPPVSGDQRRIFLIDSTIKNWGTPRIISFAVMLAMAHHPKQKYESQVLVVGNDFREVSYASPEGITEALQYTSASLCAGKGLERFFREFSLSPNDEVVLLSEPTALIYPEMRSILEKRRSAIHYQVMPESNGTVSIFRRTPGNFRKIQSIKLPLDELWKNTAKVAAGQQQEEKYIPILVRDSPLISHRVLHYQYEYFKICSKGDLYRFVFPKVAWQRKGGEYLATLEDVQNYNYGIGLTQNGFYVLLAVRKNCRKALLKRIGTTEVKEIDLTGLGLEEPLNIEFSEQRFFCISERSACCVDTEGNVSTYIPNLKPSAPLGSVTDYKTLLVNFKDICINNRENLQFNVKHELSLNKDGHTGFRMPAGGSRKAVSAHLQQPGIWKFPDGSKIYINKGGILQLTSANTDIPDIYIPTVLGETIGVATEKAFAGNDYYCLSNVYQVRLDDCQFLGRSKTMTVLGQALNISSMHAKQLAANLPAKLPGIYSEEQAKILHKKLQESGCSVSIVPAYSNWQDEQENISTRDFFQRYIDNYIKHVLNYVSGSQTS